MVLEASDAVGGLATSHRVDGVTFDTGAHFVTNRLATALGVMDRCENATHYGEAVWHRGRSAAYPLGLVRDPRFTASALVARLRAAPRAASAADRFRAEYGRALADEVAIPLVEAWSGLPGEELAPSVVDKIPAGIGETLALTAARRLTHRAVAIGYCAEAPQSANVWHVYPRDGLGVIVDRLASGLEGRIRIATPADAVVLDGDRVDGRTRRRDRARRRGGGVDPAGAGAPEARRPPRGRAPRRSAVPGDGLPPAAGTGPRSAPRAGHVVPGPHARLLPRQRGADGDALARAAG